MKYADCPTVTVTTDVAAPAADVEAVRRLWAAGDRDGAAARVPIENRARYQPDRTATAIRKQLGAYERAGVTNLRINLNRPFDRLVAELEILLGLVTDAGIDLPTDTTPGATT